MLYICRLYTANGAEPSEGAGHSHCCRAVPFRTRTEAPVRVRAAFCIPAGAAMDPPALGAESEIARAERDSAGRPSRAQAACECCVPFLQSTVARERLISAARSAAYSLDSSCSVGTCAALAHAAAAGAGARDAVQDRRGAYARVLRVGDVPAHAACIGPATAGSARFWLWAHGTASPAAAARRTSACRQRRGAAPRSARADTRLQHNTQQTHRQHAAPTRPRTAACATTRLRGHGPACWMRACTARSLGSTRVVLCAAQTGTFDDIERQQRREACGRHPSLCCKQGYAIHWRVTLQCGWVYSKEYTQCRLTLEPRRLRSGD